jgi:hypothetical protein
MKSIKKVGCQKDKEKKGDFFVKYHFTWFKSKIILAIDDILQNRGGKWHGWTHAKVFPVTGHVLFPW